MKNDKLGLLLITASLVVIVIIIGLLYQNQAKLHEKKIRIDGVAITRALSNTDFQELVTEIHSNNMIATMVEVQANTDFAYGVVVDLSGQKLYETASAGSIAPIATMPSEPFEWFGEQHVISPGDARGIREFFAPAMLNGNLAGFIRVGYYNKPIGILSSAVSDLALMALPVFLLAVLSYLLIRREVKPLGILSDKIEKASLSYGLEPASPAGGINPGEFVQRFDQFMQLVQSRVEQKGQESFSAQTSNHLLVYKQEKAESALNSFPDAVLMMDSACIPFFSNHKIEPLLGVGRDSILGQSSDEWCQNKEVLAFVLKLKDPNTSMRFSSIEYVPEDNPEKHISVSAFPLISPRDKDTLFGTMLIFKDVSQEHAAQQAAAEFVSHVSHELKTPLNSLSAYSELLLDFTSMQEKDIIESINVIHDEAERMAGLINNLLNISMIESGNLKLARKRVKLNDMMQDVLNTMSNLAQTKDLKINLNIPPELNPLRLDKELFRIAVDNLVSNAIKYSENGSSVTIEVTPLENEQIQIIVRDQGIGISEEDCKKVFLKYYRASNKETASRSGHGLGLYLAKQIIELHHGSISVESEIGKGTEFTIIFKAAPVQLEESQA